MERVARELMVLAIADAREAAKLPGLTPEQRWNANRLVMEGIACVDKMERGAPMKGLDG